MADETAIPPVMDYARAGPAKSGFPWIVLLLVPLASVAFTVMNNLLIQQGTSTHARRDMVAAAVGPNGTLSQAVKMYKYNVGTYPSSLGVLLAPPPPPQVRLWSGPYVEDPRQFIDPWGRSYQYRCPGVWNKTGFDLWSFGPDGLNGTADDIVGGK